MSFARVWRRLWRPIALVLGHVAGRLWERSPRGAAHQELGARGERLAVRYLQGCGYRIAATNFTAPIGHRRDGRAVTGEIDIIAWDETTDPPTLAFIEVKTRSSDAVADPASAVDRRKQRRIIRTARLYRRMLRLDDRTPSMAVQGQREAPERTADPPPPETPSRPSRPSCPYRYDVVGIVAAPGGETRIEIHRGFFSEDVFRQSRWMSSGGWDRSRGRAGRT